MIEKFKSFILNIHPIPEQSFDAFLDYFETIRVSKNEMIVKEHDPNKHIFFLMEGFAKLYIINDGKEMIGKFIEPINILCFTVGGTDQTTPQVNIQAIEDCILLRIARSDLEKLCSTDIHMANWWRHFAERILYILEKFAFDGFFLSPTDMYLETINALGPNLLNKVPLKSIASYCNLTPESLSRIRNRLVKK